MERKFINQFPITFKLYQEWANNPIGRYAVQNRKRGIWLRVSGCICSSIMIVAGALLQELYAVLMGSIFLVIFILRLFPNRKLKKQYELILKAQNNNVWVRTIAFSDSLDVEEGRSATHYEYSDISKISENEKYFFLFLNEDTVLRIRKDSFILGSCDDFRVFMSSVISTKAE